MQLQTNIGKQERTIREATKGMKTPIKTRKIKKNVVSFIVNNHMLLSKMISSNMSSFLLFSPSFSLHLIPFQPLTTMVALVGIDTCLLLFLFSLFFSLSNGLPYYHEGQHWCCQLVFLKVFFSHLSNHSLPLHFCSSKELKR